jgi:formate hydrogenlyase subunit 4
MTDTVLNLAFLLVMPLVFIGIINRVKSFFAGRQGPSLLQPFRDVLRLLKKGEVVSRTTTWIFRIAPSAGLAATLTAALVVPLAGQKAAFSFQGDFILFAYLLALGRFLSIIAAMDTGSSFEGMGASREAAFSALAEPALFIILSVLAFLSGSSSFEDIFLGFQRAGALPWIIAVASGVTLFTMLLAEGKRVPVDDPCTHLELTMIHEVMVLDNSGPDLALVLYGSAMKMSLMAALIARILLPAALGPAAMALSVTGAAAFLAVLVGCVESLTARLRMTHVPQFLFSMTAIAVVILSTAVLFAFGGLR